MSYPASFFRHRRSVGIASLLVLGACSTQAAVSDAGPIRPFDGRADMAAPARDAGGADTGAWADAGPARDAGTLCPIRTCDPRTSAGCAMNEACVVAGATAQCLPRVRPDSAQVAGEGAACDTPSACAEGLVCFKTRTGGTCARACCPGDDSSCGVLQRCTGGSLLVDGTTTEWARCAMPESCDVLAVNACLEGEGCYVLSADATTGCRRAGTIALGAPCERAEQCAPGLFCAGLTDRRCARICSLDSMEGPQCGTAEGSCRAYSYSPPGSGVCTLDPMAR